MGTPPEEPSIFRVPQRACDWSIRSIRICLDVQIYYKTISGVRPPSGSKGPRRPSTLRGYTAELQSILGSWQKDPWTVAQEESFRRSLSKYSAGGQKAAQAPREDTKD